MTMYLLLLLSTAMAATIAVWLYRTISRWRMSDVKVVSLSGGSIAYGNGLQRGFIGNERRADGSVVWNVKKRKKPVSATPGRIQKARSSKAGSREIRKPWGW